MEPATMKSRIVPDIKTHHCHRSVACFNCDADEQDKSVARVKSGGSIDKEAIEPKTRQTLDDAFYQEKDENAEIRGDTKLEDKDVCISSGDICRICHMGRYAPIVENRLSQDTQAQDNQMSVPSSLAYLGSLVSACKCRGTVALVHVECLERWLTESGRARCELCGYRYATKRVPRHGLFRSVAIWFHTVIATRQMLLDVGYLAMTTPVAAFSCYICALALRMLLRNGFYEIPWTIVAMLPTCLLTLIAYWRWIITLGRLHGHRWRRYWRNNFVVRLIPDNGDRDVDPIDATDGRSAARFDAQEPYEQWRFEEIEDYA